MGTGTRDMIHRCRAAGLAEPVFAVRDGFVTAVQRPPPQVAPQVTPQVTTQDKLLEARAMEELAALLGIPTTQVTKQVTKQVAAVLQAAIEPAPRELLQEAVGLQNREHFRQAYLEPLVTGAWLERTIPDKPTSRLQKYRLTPKGREWLANRPPA